MATLAGQGRVISNFALMHFRAAKHFSELTCQVEAAHVGKQFGSHFERISHYCSSCIVLGAASLEALINELFIARGPLQEAVPNFETYFWGGVQERRILWLFRRKKYIRGLEREHPLFKYKRALVLLSKPPFSRGHLAYQQADSLFGLRNCLIHFKPLWDDARRDVSLEQKLKGQFRESPFFESGADFVAKRCMSAGCASWVIDTVQNFVEAFAAASGLDPPKLGAFK
jgi:hypothetical protein